MGNVVWSEGRGGVGRSLFDPSPEWMVHSIGYHLPSLPGQALFSPSPSPRLRIGQYQTASGNGGEAVFIPSVRWVGGG